MSSVAVTNFAIFGACSNCAINHDWNS